MNINEYTYIHTYVDWDDDDNDYDDDDDDDDGANINSHIFDASTAFCFKHVHPIYHIKQ